MSRSEYDRMQADITALMAESKRKDKGMNAKEWEAYKLAVKACKSVLSNYNPRRERDGVIDE